MPRRKRKPLMADQPVPPAAPPPADPPEPPALPPEKGGRKGPEPTRYGDWENKGICSDF
ncbi:DUF1674 domain-containing protein [Sandaracinobacteroides saxicola]|uniref:DUF1674 domain-containing protein n=1 Tax=Sandaracinobacteroides saxicola TaxID=2759707 RepID=A0A7G5IF42_9SPHN|nr:DUF1674 domain-containing protein [Sandaracinobacteroides saxicola]